MGNQHIIELNGKRYDTVSGKIVVDNLPAKTSIPSKNPSKKTKAIDGFAHQSRSIPKQSAAVLRKTEKSKTLMRTLVKKPTAPKPQLDATAPQQIAVSKSISPSKMAHAQTIAKSALVRHFGSDVVSAHIKVPEILPTDRAVRVEAVAIATTTKIDPLSRGLANATSHTQPKPKKLRAHTRLAKRMQISPRVVSGGALALAAVIIGGFFAYQNIPNLNMRVAAARSGVHGSLPGYQPAGFGLKGGISYKPGQIIIGYKSNSDSRRFAITQTASSWNSEALRDNLTHDQQVANPITIPENGKTIYVWDSNAAWVDSGVLYKIEGDSKLNSDQLLRLANSL